MRSSDGSNVDTGSKAVKTCSETTRLLTKTENVAGTATGLQLALNLITCGLGTGIFTLPWSAAGASSITAVAIVAAVLALNAWTISIVVEAGERHQAFDIGSLLSRLPGSLGHVAQFTCNLAIWLSTFLCLVSYVIVVADCVLPFFGSAAELGHEEAKDQLRPKIVIAASLLALPLCFLDQSWLSFTSSLSIGANMMIFCLLVKTFLEEKALGQAPTICMAGISQGSVAMVAAMMQTVVIQACVLPMYEEMENRSPGKFNRVVAVSFFILFVLCSSFAVLGYHTFGATVSSNILLNLPHTAAGNAGRLCAAAAVLGVYPIILKPMIAPLARAGNVASRAFPPAQIATCVIVVSAAAAGSVFRDLGRINVVNGALSMGAFVAFIPFLVGLYLLQSESTAWQVAMYALLLIGSVTSVGSLFMVDNYVESLHAACIWSGAI